MFALAAKELKLTIQSEATAQTDDGMFVSRLTLGNMLARVSYDIETKEFIRSAAISKNLAIENAYHSILTYLENEKRIEIDDYNAERVSEQKGDMFFSKTWLMLFEDKAKKLKQDISAKNMALQRFFHSFNSVCLETSSRVPLLACKQASPAKKRARQQPICSSGNTDPSSVYSKLSMTLSKLRAELLRLLEPADQDMSPPSEQATT